MEHVYPLQLTLLCLLAGVAAVAVLARRLGTSYPILLVLAGLIGSLVPHVPRIPLPPDAVLYVALPPLLYAAAWQTSWREFRFHLVSVAMLALGLVFFTALGVALAAHYVLPGFDWRLGFVLGAVVSPTDAVAATSIAKRVGMPQQVVTLLEGESLVNDATGLLALEFGLELLQSGHAPPVGRAALELMWLVAGGAGVGLLVGYVVAKLERWIEEGPVELALSLLVAYVAYLLGDLVHASGVLAVVVCGLYLSRRSGQMFTAQSRLQVQSGWGALEFLLNGLLFLLLGLQLPSVLEGIHGYSAPRLGLYGLLLAGLLISLRLLWMFPGARVAYLIRTRLLGQSYPKPQARPVFVMGWTGMRGVVSLAAASSLPFVLGDGRPMPSRSLILFFTFMVILVTLVLQGLTLPAMMRALRLGEDHRAETEEAEARGQLLQEAIRWLEAHSHHAEGVPKQAGRDLLREYRAKAELLANFAAKPEQGAVPAALLAIYGEQRAALERMRRERRIGDEVYRRLERELDLELDLNESQTEARTRLARIRGGAAA